MLVAWSPMRSRERVADLNILQPEPVRQICVRLVRHREQIVAETA
jgi:hypothetical protein